MTKEERTAELAVKVEALKEERRLKKERRSKWEQWRKTKAIVRRNLPTDYNKWAYYEPSDDEEDKEEFVPPANDPAFAALEKDIDERAKRRAEKQREATKHKEMGNEFFKAGNYEKAINAYSEAIECVRDGKLYYTNRALAHIKLGNFAKAVEDCDRVLEIAEIFENGFTKSKDACFKAFTRRAMGYVGLNKHREAIEDLTQALLLEPKDVETKKLLKRTERNKREKEEAERQGTTPVVVDYTELVNNLSSGDESVVISALESIEEAAEKEEVRVTLRSTTLLPRLMVLLDSQNKIVQSATAATLCNCLLDPKIKAAVRPHATLIINRLSSLLESTDILVREKAAGTLGNLSADSLIRQEVLNSDILSQSLSSVKYEWKTKGIRYEARIERLLAILINSCTENSEKLLELHAIPVFAALLSSDSTVIQSRAACLLAKLSKHEQAQTLLKELKVTNQMLQFLDPVNQSACNIPPPAPTDSGSDEPGPKVDSPLIEHTVRVFANCAKDPSVVTLLRENNGLSNLSSIIEIASRQNKDTLNRLTDSTVGNAALCIALCALDVSCCGLLYDVIEPALKMVRDAPPAVQKNLAVALARLAKNERNLVRFRELHGVEILYQVGGKVAN
eukprot:GILJ01005337.1.p1 GENE.GILJ01005337.1~~GILJ01005337.1.p1  ORF type:complete len:731 (-),score=151.77 GILJ01005337.1:181-2046(-)